MNSGAVQVILFDSRLIPSIIESQKTCTIRFEENYSLGPAQAKASDGSIEFPIHIDHILNTYLKYSEGGITKEVLEKENFKDTTEQGFNQLFSNLKKYYPTLKLGDPISIIHFHLI